MISIVHGFERALLFLFDCLAVSVQAGAPAHAHLCGLAKLSKQRNHNHMSRQVG